MFAALGRTVVRFRRSILVATLLLAVGLAVVGAGVFDKLSSGGFQNGDMESSRASRFLEEHYGVSDANLVLLVSSDAGVDDPAVTAAGLETTRRLAGESDVTEVVSYWSAGGAPPLASRDRTKAVVVARILGAEDDVDSAIERISGEYADPDGNPAVTVGGFAEIYREVGEQTERDLRTAELITLPIVLVLLLLIFGSVVSASLPLLVGGFAIIGTFFVLSVIASLTQVSVFSVNLTTAMGLGLGVDYSLFIVSRFREELQAGADPHTAVVTTVDTAGRTVAFSALTVAIALAALLVFPLPFLRSFAYAGIPVVILAAAGAMISLSAGLAVLGPRVDAFTLWRRDPDPDKEGVWHGIATFVMRHPWPIAVGVTLLLLVLASPFLRITLGIPDDRVLPADAASRQVSEAIRAEFDSDEAGRFMLVLTDGEASDPRVANWAAALSTTEGIARVEGPTGVYAAGELVAPPGPEAARFTADGSLWVAAIPSVDPYGEVAQDALATLRASDAPGDLLVAGQTASFVDAREALLSRLPLALVLIAAVTFVLLFLMTGSLLVPLKAI
ncbi:MAG: MMPL family transporter, partial [Acidimicrobiia bacterium]|nr:MMPL family transporter [Acidimicrobiia bacterium]